MDDLLENNKLIAEFMGAKEFEANGWFLLPCKISGETPDGFESSRADLVFYHKSYDWLMPVVEKIVTIINGSDFESYNDWEDYYITFNEVSFLSLNLKNLYKDVVEFIKWYNENNKK